MLSWRDPHNPKAGGAERVSQAYLAELGRRGHEVFWFANDFPDGTASEVIDGVQIVRGGGYGSSILRARAWHHQQRPFDLIMDQHHGLPWFAPWWGKTNCVAYVHEVLGPIWGSFYPWPVSMFGRWQERWVHWLYRNVQFWVGSESTRRALLRRGVKRVQVVSYGIDLEPLADLEPKPLTQPLELISVSRLAPNKRIDHAVRALKVLLERGVTARLTVVGGGEMAGSLRELAARLALGDKVTFTGGIPEKEKDACLRRSHLLLHTSLREGWGLNVLEANAVGTPAVVYPVDGLVDATLHDETGVVTRAETPESVADGIMTLLRTPERYQVYREKARDRTREFHWRRVLPTACQWLEQQAAQPKRS
jgi:glycosyltransferase involved in cell wall biosynthesis